MNEEYVTYEQAVRLKALGFDWCCMTFYVDDIIKLPCSEIKPFPKPKNWNKQQETLSAPSIHQAAKWLRQEHNIHISVNPCFDGRWECQIVDISPLWYFDRCYMGDSYEAALSAGVSKCLEIINNKTE